MQRTRHTAGGVPQDPPPSPIYRTARLCRPDSSAGPPAAAHIIQLYVACSFAGGGAGPGNAAASVAAARRDADGFFSDPTALAPFTSDAGERILNFGSLFLVAGSW